MQITPKISLSLTGAGLEPEALAQLHSFLQKSDGELEVVPWTITHAKRKETHKRKLYEFNKRLNMLKMRWNLSDYGGKWIINPDSVSEIGCIHTAQGLEVDYIGVIIEDDLIVRGDKVLVDPSKRSSMDRSIFGWKKMMRENPDYARPLLKAIIKNTYRTLMTRGMKGCYIYCTDRETREYFKRMANQ